MRVKTDKLNNYSIPSSLIQQNCFVRDVVRLTDSPVSSSSENYLSLDEVVTDKGVELREVVVPYPVTPQYVNSFVDSSDYRKDPFSSVAQSSKGFNLGDIRDIQNVSSMDTEKAREVYNRLKELFFQSDNQSENQSDNQSDNSEVK